MDGDTSHPKNHNHNEYSNKGSAAFIEMAVCKACEQPLVLELDPEDFDEATSSAVGGQPSSVPDDLELPCLCHFHWYVTHSHSLVH